MKFLLLTLAVIALAGFLLFGADAFVGHAQSSAKQLRTEIEANIPTDHDLVYARQELRKRVRALARKRVEVAKLEASAGDAAHKAEEKEHEIAKAERELAQEAELLADPRATFQIGGRPYARAEVQADARRRLILLDKHNRELNSIRQTATDLSAAAEAAHAVMANAESVYRDLFAELELLESSIANGELVREARKLAGSFELEDGIESELANVLHRLRGTEREVWALAGDPVSSAFEKHLLIDFSSSDSADIDGRELREEIAKALGQPLPDPVGTPAAGFTLGFDNE